MLLSTFSLLFVDIFLFDPFAFQRRLLPCLLVTFSSPHTVSFAQFYADFSTEM